MTAEQLGAASCLLAIAALSVVRFPSFVRRASSRPSWLATLVGGAALFSTGAVVPVETVDLWLGAAGMVNLMQNTLAVTAFWLLLQSVLAIDSHAFAWPRFWELPVMVFSFAVPFMYINDRHASADFINEYADQWALWAYASTYMGWVIMIMWRMRLAARRRPPFLRRWIGLGAVSVAAGSLSEVVYLTNRVIGLDGSVTSIPQALFPPLFYGGIASIVLALAGFWITRVSREHMLRGVGLLLGSASTERSSRTHQTGNPGFVAYQLAVRLADKDGERPLRPVERIAFYLATVALNKQTRVPNQIEMKVSPEGVSC